MIELNTKIKKRIKKLADALSVSENCIIEESVPHDKVTLGESGGNLALEFSGGSGVALNTEIVVFRNGTFLLSTGIYDPQTQVVITGQAPPSTTTNDRIYVLYRASCEGLEYGDGGWRVGYHQYNTPPE